MPQLVKPYTYTSGTTISSTQVNANEDAIINTLNALDEDNLDPATQIPNSMLEEIQPGIVDAHATDAAEYLTAITPGTTASPSLPDKLTDELERLRYRIGANKGYLTSAVYMDASAVVQTAGWIEPPIKGRNLLPNAGFEVHSAGTPNAPDGWSLVSTPSAIAIEAHDADHLSLPRYKKSLRIATDGANEGISVSIDGLKASTKYLVGMAFSITNNGTTPGTIKLTTSGGLGSGAYQNLNLTSSSEDENTIQVFNGVVKSAAAFAAMTVSILATESGSDFNLHSVWMYELSDGYPDELPHIPMQTATDITSATFPTTWTGSAVAWQTDTLTALSLTQFIPARGYRATYEVVVPYNAADVADSREGCRVYGAILLTIDGGATNVVSGPVCDSTWNEAGGADTELAGTLRLKYVTESLVPGSSYVFAFRLGVWDDSSFEQVSVPPVLSGLQMEARATLVLERL